MNDLKAIDRNTHLIKIGYNNTISDFLSEEGIHIIYESDAKAVIQKNGQIQLRIERYSQEEIIWVRIYLLPMEDGRIVIT